MRPLSNNCVQATLSGCETTFPSPYKINSSTSSIPSKTSVSGSKQNFNPRKTATVSALSRSPLWAASWTWSFSHSSYACKMNKHTVGRWLRLNHTSSSRGDEGKHWRLSGSTRFNTTVGGHEEIVSPWLLSRTLWYDDFKPPLPLLLQIEALNSAPCPWKSSSFSSSCSCCGGSGLMTGQVLSSTR